MYTGRGAPGALEIPIDIQYAANASMDIRLPDNDQFAPDESKLELVINALQHTQRRILLVGGGAIAAEAQEEVQALAEQLQIPVLTTVDGRGVIPEDHPLCIGNYYNSAGMYQAIADADSSTLTNRKPAIFKLSKFFKQIHVAATKETVPGGQQTYESVAGLLYKVMSHAASEYHSGADYSGGDAHLT